MSAINRLGSVKSQLLTVDIITCNNSLYDATTGRHFTTSRRAEQSQIQQQLYLSNLDYTHMILAKPLLGLNKRPLQSTICPLN